VFFSGTTLPFNHFVKVGIKMLNIEAKGTSNVHTGYPVEHSRIFLLKVAYSMRDVNSKSFQMCPTRLNLARRTSLYNQIQAELDVQLFHFILIIHTD
jgi:hypothetical protein